MSRSERDLRFCDLDMEFGRIEKVRRWWCNKQTKKRNKKRGGGYTYVNLIDDL